MADEFSGFDWDQGNRKKCQAHGVSLAEIESLFADRVSILPDLSHSDAETRFLAIGRSLEGRHIFVAFTIRVREGTRHIRPISARYMHQKEIEHHEQAHPKA